MPKLKITRTHLYKYGLAILFTFIALALTALFWSGIKHAPFTFFFGAIVFSAWRGGLGPGMVSALLAIVAADYFLIAPVYTIFSRSTDLLQFTIFSAVSFLISSLAESRNRTEQSLRNVKDELTVILNSVADGITAQDADGKPVFANAAAARLAGYDSAEALINTSITDSQRKYEMLDEDDNILPFSALPRHHVFKHGERASLVFRMRFTDTGQEQWIHLSSSPVFDKQGKVKLAVNVFRDLTQTTEAEHALSRYAAIVQNSNDAIIAKTMKGFITSWNPAAERLYGYRAEEVIGQHISLIFPEEIKASELQLWDRLESGEKIEHYETRRMHKDGHHVDVSLTISPIRMAGGRVSEFSGIERDITQRRQLEALREESQARVRKVLDNLTVFVGMITPDGVLVEVNRAVLAAADLQADEVVGKKFDETYWWSFSEESQSRLRASIARGAQGETSRYDVEMRIAGEDLITVDFMLAPVFNDDNQLEYLVASAIDITVRKQRENQLNMLTSMIETQRQRLDAVIRNVPGIIYDTTINVDTGQQTMNFISDYTETMLGYSPDAWKSDPSFWRKIMNPDDSEFAAAEATAAFDEERHGAVQFRCRNSSGETVFVESHFNFIKEGSQVRQFGVIMDITDRKQSEQAEAEYLERLRRSNEELEQFAYVASHDLQEPLRKISSYLQLVEQRYADQLDQDGKEFIEFAVDGATRMKNLISDLLMYSRVQRNKDEFATVDTRQVLEQVLDSLALSIEDCHAEITHDTLPEVFGNEAHLTQLFQNLIGNALKFHGDALPKIHVGVQRRARAWEFCVRDNGIGMEPKYFDRIFAVFQRLHSRSAYEGTGIGLAICKRVVENHGGRIWVESEPDHGTTFYFTISR